MKQALTALIAVLLLEPMAALHAAEHVAVNPVPASQGLPSAGEVLSTRIPVTSLRIDVGDDPENAYSGAPQFNSAFFGDRTQLLSKYYGLHLKYRREFGISFRYYLHEDHSFQDPLPTTKKEAILDSPVM